MFSSALLYGKVVMIVYYNVLTYYIDIILAVVFNTRSEHSTKCSKTRRKWK